MTRHGCVSLLLVAMLCLVVGCKEKASTEQAKTNDTPAAGSPAGDTETGAVGQGSAPAEEPAQPVIAPEDLPTPVELTEDDWPWFRGQQNDAKVHSQVKLARSWPAEGPPVLWETTVGEGYSSPSVVGDRVYLNDYNEETKEWMVRCLSFDDGEEQWTYKVKKEIRPNHGITRSAPATDGGFVFAIDPKCELHCLDARNGNLIWKKFLPKLYDSMIPAWYNGQCPLIEGDRVIIAAGGKALLVAFDKATGEPVWETPNPDQQLITHSSVMPVELDGVRQYAYYTMQGLVGIDAETGAMLWQFPWKFSTAVPTTPLALGDGKFLVTSSYGARTAVCQVTHDGDTWKAEELLSLAPPTDGWNSEVHTPIVHNGKIYGVGKKSRGLWTCLDMECNEVWNSRRKSFDLGGYVLADGMFFALDGRSGALRLIDAEADEYQQLAEAKILSGPDVWAPPVIVRGKLLVRDLGKMLCLDVREQTLAADTSDSKLQ
ncbi:PQQ-binding-like beta-propeller repeat protein [Aeoliella mucimassa]|uniref:Outer membrane biogenesis protein BamB n=1 Tax=Aeoliella mucimassa TaxID=2527972 RepID=A0A518AT38_9BACT|nr:PQQ-binding-like beta-propeller repeat protein [Aeoliella mucimassa]QDU57895.1 outer membrane biogenesis protein BamB [Aeoliella mucimassa]